jgi:hypothetical protein
MTEEAALMPATVTTREVFPKVDHSRDAVKREAKLRIKAGAIRSEVEDDGDDWGLVTEWNVIGEQ